MPDTRLLLLGPPAFEHDGRAALACESPCPEAVAQYRGLLLDGLDVADAPEFELWLDAQRERFGQAYVRAVSTVVETPRGLEMAERLGNRGTVAGYRAKQGLAARGKGDLDSAERLLEEARLCAAEASDLHLQTRIDLWLAELHRDGGREAAAAAALSRASERLQGHEDEQGWLTPRVQELRR